MEFRAERTVDPARLHCTAFERSFSHSLGPSRTSPGRLPHARSWVISGPRSRLENHEALDGNAVNVTPPSSVPLPPVAPWRLRLHYVPLPLARHCGTPTSSQRHPNHAVPTPPSPTTPRRQPRSHVEHDQLSGVRRRGSPSRRGRPAKPYPLPGLLRRWRRHAGLDAIDPLRNMIQADHIVVRYVRFRLFVTGRVNSAARRAI